MQKKNKKNQLFPYHNTRFFFQAESIRYYPYIKTNLNLSTDIFLFQLMDWIFFFLNTVEYVQLNEIFLMEEHWEEHTSTSIRDDT